MVGAYGESFPRVGAKPYFNDVSAFSFFTTSTDLLSMQGMNRLRSWYVFCLISANVPSTILLGCSR